MPEGTKVLELDSQALKPVNPANQAPSSSNISPKPVCEASRCQYRPATDKEDKGVRNVYSLLKVVSSSLLVN